MLLHRHPIQQNYLPAKAHPPAGKVFQPAVVIPAAKAQAEARRKAAVAKANERKNVENQIKRELAALYPRAYVTTSTRIIVTSAKDKDKYASEFANAVKLFEDWQKKWAEQAKRKSGIRSLRQMVQQNDNGE
jgi:hypothetical protein